MNPYTETALAAVRSLRYAATRGDAEAVAGLVAIGNTAAGHLAALASHPEGYPGRIATDTVAATAESWPVACPAIEELRLSNISTIPQSLGSGLPFRIKKGRTKPRGFGGGRSGFAKDAFDDIELVRLAATPELRDSLLACWHTLNDSQKTDWRNLSAILPPLDGTEKTLGLWKNAGVRWAEWCCSGQWKTFPWPDEVMRRAKQETNTRERGIETAVKEILGLGFASIAPATY